MIMYALAEARRFAQPRGTRLVLVSCVAIVGFVLVIQAARGQQPSLHDDLGDALTGAGTAFVFVAVAAGASAVAKEHSSGALVMLLTWEPRRGRVLLVKALAIGAGTGVAALIIAATVALGLAIPSAASGGSGAFEASWAGARLTQVGLLALGSAAAGLVGAVLTFVTRSAALTLAVFVLLYLLGERALDAVAPDAAGWGPASLIVRLAGGADGLFGLHIANSTAVWRVLAWLAVLVAASMLVFRVREAR